MTATASRIRSAVAGRFDQIFEPTDPEDRSQLPVLIIIWLVWTMVMIMLNTAHEPWRDELQAWAIARSSGQPLQLLVNLRYEGHPPLWHLLLWPVAKVIPGIAGMKFVTILVGSAATWIALRFMPVSIWIRVALLFGYFPLYEYGVINRSYSVAWLCVVLSLWLAHRAHTPKWLMAVALGALACTTGLAVPLAFAIALALWGGHLWASPGRHADRRMTWGFGTALVAVFLYGVIENRTKPETIWSALTAPLVAAAPISRRTHHFWGNLLVNRLDGVGVILGIVLVVVIARLLRKSVSAQTVWLVSTFGFFIVMAESGRSVAPRFAGIVWMGAIAGVWFAASERRRIPEAERQPIHPAVKIACVLVLAGSLGASAWASWVDSTTTFSGGRTAADWITERATGPVAVLCGSTAAVCSAVSIELDVPAYRSPDGEPFTFVVYAPGWDEHLDEIDILNSATQLELRTGRQVFVVGAPDWFLTSCAESMAPDRNAVFDPISVCLPGQPAP